MLLHHREIVHQGSVQVQRVIERKIYLVVIVHVQHRPELLLENLVRHRNRNEHHLLDALLLRIIAVVQYSDTPLVLPARHIAVHDEIGVALIAHGDKPEIVAVVHIPRIFRGLLPLEGKDANHRIVRHVVLPDFAAELEENVFAVVA